VIASASIIGDLVHSNKERISQLREIYNRKKSK